MVGCDFFELAADGERPPRSAKLVASLDLGSGPGGGDYRKYYICSDKHRTGWALWEMINDYDTGRPIYARRAWGEPYKGYRAVEAAKRAFEAMMTMKNIDIAAIEAARRGL